MSASSIIYSKLQTAAIRTGFLKPAHKDQFGVRHMGYRKWFGYGDFAKGLWFAGGTLIGEEMVMKTLENPAGSRLTSVSGELDNIIAKGKAYFEHIAPERVLSALKTLLGMDAFKVKAQAAIHALTPAEVSPLDLIAGGKQGAIDKENAGIFGVCDTGGRKNNEDGMAYLELNGKKYLFIADGAGGHEKGEKASEIALTAILREIQNKPGDIDNAIRLAHAAVLEAFTADTTDRKPMTTIAAVMLEGDTATVAHIGDSPVWKIKADGSIELLTVPHNKAATYALINLELQGFPSLPLGEKFIEAIEIGREGQYGHHVNAMLGIAEHFPEPIPQFKVKLEDGDRLLAFSDGLEALSKRQIKELIGQNRAASSKELALILLQQAKAEMQKAGIPKDNVTLFLFDKMAEVEPDMISTAAAGKGTRIQARAEQEKLLSNAAQSQITQRDERIAELIRENGQLQLQRNEARNALQRITTELSNNRARNDALAAANIELHSRLTDALDEKKTAASQAAQTIRELERQILDNNTQIRLLTEELKQTKRTVGDPLELFSAGAQAIRHQIDQNGTETASVRTILADTRAAIVKLREEAAALQESLAFYGEAIKEEQETHKAMLAKIDSALQMFITSDRMILKAKTRKDKAFPGTPEHEAAQTVFDTLTMDERTRIAAERASAEAAHEKRSLKLKAEVQALEVKIGGIHSNITDQETAAADFEREMLEFSKIRTELEAKAGHIIDDLLTIFS